MAQFLSGRLARCIALVRLLDERSRANLLTVVVIRHDSLRTDRQITARVNLDPILPVVLSRHELLPCSASIGA